MKRFDPAGAWLGAMAAAVATMVLYAVVWAATGAPPREVLLWRMLGVAIIIGAILEGFRKKEVRR